MALFRFELRLSKAKDSLPSPGGYTVRLMLRDESGDSTELAAKELAKPSFNGDLRVISSAAKLQSRDVYLEIKRRNGVGGAVLAVVLGNPGIGRVLDPKVGDQHARTARGKSSCRRSTDAVVPTRYEGDVTAEIKERCTHGRIAARSS